MLRGTQRSQKLILFCSGPPFLKIRPVRVPRCERVRQFSAVTQRTGRVIKYYRITRRWTWFPSGKKRCFRVRFLAYSMQPRYVNNSLDRVYTIVVVSKRICYFFRHVPTRNGLFIERFFFFGKTYENLISFFFYSCDFVILKWQLYFRYSERCSEAVDLIRMFFFLSVLRTGKMCLHVKICANFNLTCGTPIFGSPWLPVFGKLQYTTNFFKIFRIF